MWAKCAENRPYCSITRLLKRTSAAACSGSAAWLRWAASWRRSQTGKSSATAHVEASSKSPGNRTMIANDQELRVTLERITKFQDQVTQLRSVETNPDNYRASVSGFLAELDRMQLEVREYLSLLPKELVEAK